MSKTLHSQSSQPHGVISTSLIADMSSCCWPFWLLLFRLSCCRQSWFFSNCKLISLTLHWQPSYILYVVLLLPILNLAIFLDFIIFCLACGPLSFRWSSLKIVGLGFIHILMIKSYYIAINYIMLPSGGHLGFWLASWVLTSCFFPKMREHNSSTNSIILPRPFLLSFTHDYQYKREGYRHAVPIADGVRALNDFTPPK